jgi:hypothetical protein
MLFSGFDFRVIPVRLRQAAILSARRSRAMTMLVVNTICGEFGKKAETAENAEKATVSFRLLESDTACEGLIKGFYGELIAIEKDYPKNLKVSLKNLEQ